MNIFVSQNKTSNHSIKRRLVAIFVLVIISLTSISLAVFAFGLMTNRTLISLLNQEALFNTYFIALQDADVSLENYIIRPDEINSTAYQTTIEKLNQASQDLQQTFQTRQFIDNYHMTETYVQLATAAFNDRRSNDFSIFNPAFNEARYTKDLIVERYSHLYTAVDQVITARKIEIANQRLRMFQMTWLLIGLVGLGSLVISIHFANKMTQPILRLAGAAKQVANGNYALQPVPYTGDDESSILTQSFNTMIEKIRQQIESIQEKSRIEQNLQTEKIEHLKTHALLKETELKVLQARVNPHFLFNSLNVVSQTAYLENASQTVDKIGVLSDLLRYSLDGFNKTVTLADEIINVRNYFAMQQDRFDDRVDFQINFDPQCAGIKVPSFILQPFVENAIVHGIATYKRDGIVGLDVQVSEGLAKIKIYDNGLGISQDKIEQLYLKFLQNDLYNESQGIGLSNVYARLKLCFNEAFHLRITSTPRQYTEVCLEIPFKSQES